MLRKIAILALVATTAFGVAVARPHGASAQGAVICGVLKLPHAAAAHSTASAGTVSGGGELPCSSFIVAEPAMPTATPTPTPTATPTPDCNGPGNGDGDGKCKGHSGRSSAAGAPMAGAPTAPPPPVSNGVVHCSYSYTASMTDTATDPDVLVGSGQLIVHWSDGGTSVAAVTAVAGRSTLGDGIIALTGMITSGRFAGGLMNLESGVAAGMPLLQLNVVFA